MRAADRLRSWGRKVSTSPLLAGGIAAGVLLVCAWIGWAIHVTGDHGARAGIGVLIAWPAILAALTLISLPFIWAFRLLRGRHTEEEQPDSEPESDAELTEPG